MQIVSLGDNLPEMSKPIFWEKYFRMSAGIFLPVEIYLMNNEDTV